MIGQSQQSHPTHPAQRPLSNAAYHSCVTSHVESLRPFLKHPDDSTVTTFIGAAIKRNTAMITQCSGQSTSTNTHDWESRLPFCEVCQNMCPEFTSMLDLVSETLDQQRTICTSASSTDESMLLLGKCCETMLVIIWKTMWCSGWHPKLNRLIREKKQHTHLYTTTNDATKYQDNGIARIATHWPVLLQQADHTGKGLQVLNNNYMMQGCIPCSNFCYL